jgi:hypothetical protein
VSTVHFYGERAQPGETSNKTEHVARPGPAKRKTKSEVVRPEPPPS